MTDSLAILQEKDKASGATPPVDGNTSDGHHTFNELYEHRHMLFSVLCATYCGWKSKLHNDGTMYDGWFIAGVQTPKGQATYHLPLCWWDRYKCEELKEAPEFDGHTANEVLTRIPSLCIAPVDVEFNRRIELIEEKLENHRRTAQLGVTLYTDQIEDIEWLLTTLKSERRRIAIDAANRRQEEIEEHLLSSLTS